MIISLNWLRQYVEVTMPIEELGVLIGARLVEIEEIIDLGVRYKGATVAKVVSVKDHPDADRLHVVEIDDGGVAKDLDRLENGHVQVVCGAPNVREGMMVAWLPPGATVPSTYMDAEPLVLDSRKLRGVVSNGMLASARELAFSDDHEGIVEIDKKEASPGDSLADVYELNDYLLDIENKSLTHRPDCFGLIGFAREVAGIQGLAFQTPDWLKALEPVLGEKQTLDGILAPDITIENAELAARYQAVVLANIEVDKKSPLQIQSYLSRVGMRAINAVVDITNYLMLVTGQPLHAFDYDKFVKVGGESTPKVTVREAREGEKMTLLDGRDISLSSSDIVITSGEVPVALAGAMGGASTEVDSETKHILLESATFDLFRLRATQMRHGIFSEAITRFTKGQPAALTAPVLASAVRMFSSVAGGVRATDIVESYPNKTEPTTLSLPLTKIQQVLGDQLSAAEAATPLKNTEFSVEEKADSLVVTAPYWRADIHIDEDVIEEIGRLRGFDSIEPVLPTRDFTAVEPTGFDMFRDKLREVLARAGANEILTYNFVHGDLLKKAGQSPDKAYRLTNALSPDLQYFRLSLTPNLLDKVHSNIRMRYEQFALFEIGKVHEKDIRDEAEQDVPAEFYSLAAVVAATEKQAKGTAFYNAKYLLDFMLRMQGLEASYHPYVINDIVQPSLSRPYEQKRTAIVRVNGETVGVLGEFRASVRKAFKLPEYAAGFEVDIAKLFALAPARASSYERQSRFPGTEQDVCVQVPTATSYQTVIDIVKEALKNETLEWRLSPVDIYQPEGAGSKNITFRVHLLNRERTIATDEASVVIAYISEALLAGISDSKIV